MKRLRKCANYLCICLGPFDYNVVAGYFKYIGKNKNLYVFEYPPGSMNPFKQKTVSFLREEIYDRAVHKPRVFEKTLEC